MGAEITFTPEKLVIAVTFSRGIGEHSVWQRLEREFGPIDVYGEPYPFSFTDYYESEMGTDLTKQLISFERKIDPQTLSAVKWRTNEIETESAVNGCRRINLDPGILDFNRFILATTKNRGHRIPLTDGIYGELTLLFVRGAFCPFPWTYADYRSESVLADLEKIRLTLKSCKK